MHDGGIAGAPLEHLRSRQGLVRRPIGILRVVEGLTKSRRMRQLDLNAGVGEGDPQTDEALLRVVTSANVACGFHAGDAHSMRATVALATRNGVAVGAIPGFTGREG